MESFKPDDKIGNLAVLSYDFLFDVDSSWPNGYAFEQDLAKFLDSFNLEGRIVKTVEGINTGRRIIHIVRKPEPPPPPPQRPVSNQGQAPKVQLKEMTKEYGKSKR